MRGVPPAAPSAAAAKRAHPMPPGTPQPPPPAAAEEDMMDEDVFVGETILEEDETALLLLDRDEALASRLSRWKRPADLVSGCSRTVGNRMKVKILQWHAVASWTWDAQDETCGICRMAFDGCCPDSFQQLDIDVIGESHKELLPNSSAPAAIIRIFGVTREVCAVRCMDLSHISISAARQGWILMIFHASIKH